MPEPSAQRVRIRDVALAAGVSAATVSHVYNGRGRVSERTRARVKAIGDRLGYQPNQTGQALRLGRTNVIAVVASFRDPRVTEASFMPCFRNILAGAALEAGAMGLAVTAGRAGVDGQITTTLSYDGIIVVDPMPSDPVVERALSLGRPVVAVGGYDERPTARIQQIRLGIRDALPAYLDTIADAEEEVRPAIFVGARLDHFTNDAIAGFQRWCARRGITPRGGALEPGESLDHAATRMLSGALPPTVVHCMNESFSAAILRAAERAGLDVPGQLRVTTVGDPGGLAAQHGVDYFATDPFWNGSLAVKAMAELVSGETPADLLLELPSVAVSASPSSYRLA
ncbi:LacI family DNA-binding transcriptional regulator [Microbacterium sp. UBA3486]|uniref:LacI family DNA-binding transcriptional regulator n=1 Tax=Microbacterium TaxID=33882 RepID=UPI0025EC1210|nr:MULTISPECIES: LacI family DNA-binding transcriptional regulator [Microbacterium]